VFLIVKFVPILVIPFKPFRSRAKIESLSYRDMAFELSEHDHVLDAISVL
jgi:hypothetical protein